MKCARQTKKPPACPPRQAGYRPPAHYVTHQAGGQQEDPWEETIDTAGSVFSLNRKAAGITKKELVYELGWSKTYIDEILAGRKNDPIEQARKVCLMLRKRGRTDLVASTIVHIAGGNDFDGRVLTAEQVSALEMLAKAVKE